jgi:hypothetical protein
LQQIISILLDTNYQLITITSISRIIHDFNSNRKRQYKRYNITSGGFALLQFDDTEVLGSIKDISAGGLSLSHIDDNVEINELSRISINLISERSCNKQLHGRNLWSKKEDGAFTTSMVKMKRRGVEFEQLDNKMLIQLSEFIDTLNKK